MAIGNWAFQLKYEPKQGAPQRMPLVIHYGSMGRALWVLQNAELSG